MARRFIVNLGDFMPFWLENKRHVVP